jgi:hypothetical protein
LEDDTGLDATAIDTTRKMIAGALYGNCWMPMYIYQNSPLSVASFFSLEDLRSPAAPPAASLHP